MAKRKTPSQLVYESSVKAGPRNWFAQLPTADQEYVREVALEMRSNPMASTRSVARSLKRELGIKRNEPAIAIVLKELANEA